MLYYEHEASQAYRVTIDMSEVHGNTMTDIGIPVKDLEPIDSCMLTPGDPSPVGRGPGGDLAYVVLPGSDYINVTRLQAAELAHIYASGKGISEADMQQSNYKAWGDGHFLLRKLLNDAAPRVLFDTTNHGELAHKRAITSIFDGTYRENAFYKDEGRLPDPD